MYYLWTQKEIINFNASDSDMFPTHIDNDLLRKSTIFSFI